MERLSFYTEISNNKRNSVFLILLVVVILVALIYAIGLAIGADVIVISILAVMITLIYVLVSYYNADKIALSSVNAKKARQDDYRQYHHLVEGLCLASGMPKPKLYVIESEQINAFASGRNPENSVICITTGALKKLNKQELEGVLSHELSHIASYDIRFMTLTAVLVGMIAIISQIFLRSLFFRGGRNDENNAIFLIIGIALAILAPILVALVQLAISRKREYGADASAVRFIRSPTGLVGALKKIKQENKNYELKVSGAVSPLFLSKPFNSKEIFQTHPDIDKRIARLERM